jgi:hypothetical protein
VGVNGTDPRRVDEHEPCVQQLVIELDVRELDAAVVPRIARLGYVVGELGERPLHPAAVLKRDRKAIAIPGALTALELAEHHEVESILGDPLTRRGKVPVWGLSQQPVAKRKHLIDGAQTECPLVDAAVVAGRRNARPLATTQNRRLRLTSTFVTS